VTSFHFFFVYPVGHFGFTAVTFFEVLPLTQVIDVFFKTPGAADVIGVVEADGVGAGASCESFTLMVGDE
jgi:hypothetical protein